VRLFLWTLGGDIGWLFDEMSVKNEALLISANSCFFLLRLQPTFFILLLSETALGTYIQQIKFYFDDLEDDFIYLISITTLYCYKIA